MNTYTFSVTDNKTGKEYRVKAHSTTGAWYTVAIEKLKLNEEDSFDYYCGGKKVKRFEIYQEPF